jgi:GTP-binding protein LepA
VAYRVVRSDGEEYEIDNPADLPDPSNIDRVLEPFLNVTVITPSSFTGALMDLCQSRRGEMVKMEYLSPERLEIQYKMPLGEVVTDFFDQMKSRSQGYASLDYEPIGYEPGDLVKVDVLIAGEPVDAFSSIVHREKSYDYGKKMVDKLKELIPRQQFDVPIQAAIGSRILSRQTVKAYRKDVTAKLYGGDVSRKRKLLEKQKKGKKRMKSLGRVEVPSEAFTSALRLDE